MIGSYRGGALTVPSWRGFSPAAHVAFSETYRRFTRKTLRSGKIFNDGTQSSWMTESLATRHAGCPLWGWKMTNGACRLKVFGGRDQGIV